MMLSFTVVGIPRPQPRPRIMGKHVVSNTDDVKVWKLAIKLAYLNAVDHARSIGVYDPNAPLKQCTVRTVFFLPQNASAETERPMTGADGDNLTKAVWDALQDAGAFLNDAQIVEWAGEKHYANDDDGPGVWLAILYDDAAPSQRVRPSHAKPTRDTRKTKGKLTCV